MTRYPMVWLTTPAILFSVRGPAGSGKVLGRHRRLRPGMTLDMAVAPAPWREPAPLVLRVVLPVTQVAPSFGVSLAEVAEVSAPELGVVDGADRGADAVRETGQVI